MGKASAKTRSQIMASVKARGTGPEMFVRRHLHAKGLRYRLTSPKLPGSPDLIFRKYRAVVFVHGCFWHGHSNCKFYRLPGTRAQFWQLKVEQNRQRDERVVRELLSFGWRVCVIWACT